MGAGSYLQIYLLSNLNSRDWFRLLFSQPHRSFFSGQMVALENRAALAFDRFWFSQWEANQQQRFTKNFGDAGAYWNLSHCCCDDLFSGSKTFLRKENTMSETIQIRYAQVHDAESITNFNIAMAQETEDKTLDFSVISAGVRKVFENPEYGFYLVAEEAERVVGSLMITTEWSDWRNRLFWWIQSVYIASDFRRRGVYSQLHHFVRKLAQEEPNVCGIRLYVENENHRAQKTYASLGMYKTHYQFFEEEF